MRAKKIVPMDLVQHLFTSNFKRKEVAKLLGVSEITLKRRMEESNTKVRQSYTNITDDELRLEIKIILENHPNTGQRMCQGFLQSRGIKVVFSRVQEAMRVVDPVGVACRSRMNKCIVRRVYYVRYANEIWHVDTNLKLVRWKFVVKGAIDGRSRTCIYLDVADNNTSVSQMESFLKGVQDYGVPLRTRSDKGLENRGIAGFMLRNRGENRASHICGRSVHNQRIERFWVDVFQEVLVQYILLFRTLENRGYLDINNDLHMRLLHYVFLPRMQHHLSAKRLAWNNHKLSSEHNKTPNQLMLVNLPPSSRDLCLAEEIDEDSLFACHTAADVFRFNAGTNLTQPSAPRFQFSELHLNLLSQVDIRRHSRHYGLDIYTQCYSLLATLA